MGELELLAPVGKIESLYAAIENGADAVYLGGKLFNARHYASNFTDEEMINVVSYAHLRDVKVYVTMNILLDESEIEPALDYAKFLYDIGVDALIIQDLGFAYVLRKVLPNLDLHASTQMTIHNSKGAQLLYENGFKRVVLARETPLEEIRKIKDSCPIELEVFVHGALCVSYSGQCLMSSMIGGRSGNRGRCAQPCRMPSSLVDERGSIMGTWKDQHILSPKDLNTVEEMEALIQAGVISFKIEGRMKRPEYVATVTRVYRKAMDFGSQHISSQDQAEVEQIFNRGFTRGLGFGEFGQDFISSQRPDNKGILLGRVLKVARDSMAVKLEVDLEVGDDLELVFGKSQYRGMKSKLSGQAGDVVELQKLGPVKMGQEIYRKSSMELLKKAQASYEVDSIKKEIDLSLDLSLGQAPSISLSYGDLKLDYRLEEKIQASKNKPLDRARVVDQISKLGDRIYTLARLDLSMDDNIFMPVSSLNSLRRGVLDLLDKKLLDSYLKEPIDEASYQELKEKVLGINNRQEDKLPGLAVELNDYAMAAKLDLSGLDRVYITSQDQEEVEKILGLLDQKVEKYLVAEKILYSQGLARLEKLLVGLRGKIDGLSVGNLGSLKLAQELGHLRIHGDMGLNIFNSYGLDFLRENQVESSNLSAELNLTQIEKIAKRASIDISSLIYGHILVMTTKHCPMSLYKGCKNDLACSKCQYRSGYRIKDRVGAEFRMLRKTGYTNIYNPGPLVILDDLDSLKRAGIDQFRLDFLFERDPGEILEKYKEMNKGELSMLEAKDYVNSLKSKGITKGHYFRGIMD